MQEGRGTECSVLGGGVPSLLSLARDSSPHNLTESWSQAWHSARTQPFRGGRYYVLHCTAEKLRPGSLHL